MWRRMSKFKLTEEGKRTFKDFLRFSNFHLQSEDIDPVYPVLRVLQRGMDTETQLWHSFLYVAWYNLASSHHVYLRYPKPDEAVLEYLEDKKFSTGVERRNFRGVGRIVPHIQSYLEEISHWDSQGAFYMAEADPEATELEELHANWRAINDQVRSIHGNGRWAGYKHCEVLRRVNDLPLEAPDMGNQHSSGPRQGLNRFYGVVEGEGPEAIEILDAMGIDLQRKMAKAGVELDIEHLETVLCDWNSVAKGKYYVGHDIDHLQHQIEEAESKGLLKPQEAQILWDARKKALPNQFLGELNGWHGVDRNRQKAYVNRGEIVIRRKQ